jgi:membrane protein
MHALSNALGGLTVRKLLRRVGRECIDDDLFGRSAQLSYYFLLAIFPFFLILATVLGFMAQTGSRVIDSMLKYIGQFAPSSAYHLVLSTVREIRAGADGGKLSIGIIGTLWAASMGVGAIIDGLNKAYEVKDARPWWRAQLLSIALTLALGGFGVAALVLILYGSQFAHFIASRMGIQPEWVAAWGVIRWPLAICMVLLAFMIIYKYAPDLQAQKWRRTIPGALVAAVLWLGASIGLRIYLHLYNSYHATYGSLGGVIILLLWFYLSGAALLIGGEVNSEIENAAALSGDREAHRAGEKAPLVRLIHQ